MKPIADEMAFDCMSAWMRMEDRIITAIYDETLSDLGFKGSQLNLLVTVFRYETIRQTHLATLFNIDERTLSCNVTRCAAKDGSRRNRV